MTRIESLPNSVVTEIKNFIIYKEIQTAPLIKDDVFNLLEQHCTVLYYPQEDEENDGCHVLRLVNGKPEHFVYINTHKSIEKQVFTAAHELGHILKLHEHLKEKCSAYKEKYEENAMSRFAAGILMPQNMFVAQVADNYKNYCGQGNSIALDNLIKFSIYLMDFFFVPFKSVIIRLNEVGFLSKDNAEHIINNENILHQINGYIKNLGYKRLGIRSDKKSIKDYAELISKVEEKKIFNAQKLAAIREKMDLPPISTEPTENCIIKISEPKSE
ncbi:MAG: ImmA/IrrE family metallo-endopeptidase [Treponema sp.]|nr:ImmA/IrrE family metallo-endopeptidase [Treponema sp.]